MHYSKSIAGNIFKDSQPPPNESRYGSIRSVSEIEGKAYAVGLRGMVYKLDKLNQWTRIDENLSSDFDIQAIHGFDESDIYAVGFSGELWHFNGKEWTKHELPTNLNLTAVKCAGDGMVYIVGHKGIMLRGNRKCQWEVIPFEGLTDDIWGIEWYEEKLYCSTMSNVYRLNESGFKLVDFGSDYPKSCYQLSVKNDVMWSIGETDIMSLFENKWSRVL